MEHLLSIRGQRKVDEDMFYPFVPLRENAHAPKCRQPKAREFPVSTGIFLTFAFARQILLIKKMPLLILIKQ
jgi:hypothetical protein